MAKRLYIVGAGGFGREVFAWLQDCVCSHGTAGVDWELVGFLDDDAGALDGFEYPYAVVGALSDFTVEPDQLFVCGIGAVAVKRRVCAALLAQGAEFMQVVHGSAIVGPNVRIGAGAVICPRVTLTCDVEVGSMAMVNCHSTLGHDARLGAWTTVSAHCDLTGYTRVGEGVFLGSGARIIPGKSVGDGATVGAGSVVIRAVPEGVTVFGNPARVI